MSKVKIKVKGERVDDERMIEPEEWTRIAKRLIWRCCGCGRVHYVKFRVVGGEEIEIRGWRGR